VQGLNANQTIDDIFVYTIKDSDGDTSTTTLTITITGNDNDLPTINPITSGQVCESGMADGSNPSDTDIFSNTFTISAIDGLEKITIAGIDITESELNNSSTTPKIITTPDGDEFKRQIMTKLRG